MRWSDALARLLRPDRHPMIRLLESQRLTVADVLGTDAPQPSAPAAPRGTTGSRIVAPGSGAGVDRASVTVPGSLGRGRPKEAQMGDSGPTAMPGPADAPTLSPVAVPIALPASDLSSRAAELPVVRPSHEVTIVDHHRFAQAVCTCGWLGAARRSRGNARGEARDHALLYAGTVVPGDPS